MNISEVFIRRPIATSLLMAAIALFGVVAYRALPVSDLPTVDFPTIQVQAGLPGGDPGSMAASVASPLERQFTTIAGVDSMISQSSMGNTQVTLQFDLGRPIDSAAVDVQTAISEAMPLLPAGMPNPPTFRKQNPADQDILQLALVSKTVPLSVLDEYAETFIAPRISMVNGVSQVEVWGQSKYAVRVQVDPDKLRAQEIGINEVDQALQNWNVSLPTGQLFGPTQTFNIKAAGQLINADEFKPVIVTYRQGRPVRLEQVAKVLDSVEDNMNATWFYSREGGTRAINLALKRQPGVNTIEVTDNVRALLPQLEAAATADDPSRVINIGSIDGISVPLMETYSYSASKAGVHQLTSHLAKQLGRRNITVNAIAPGPFESKMMAETLRNFGDAIARTSPLGRIGRPDDMAGVAIYLASRAGAYVTGAVIPVDGGIATTK